MTGRERSLYSGTRWWGNVIVAVGKCNCRRSGISLILPILLPNCCQIGPLRGFVTMSFDVELKFERGLRCLLSAVYAFAGTVAPPGPRTIHRFSVRSREMLHHSRDDVSNSLNFGDGGRPHGRRRLSLQPRHRSHDQGKLAEAVAELRTAIRFGPNVGTVHTELGSALREQGKLAQAIAELRAATRFSPTTPSRLITTSALP